METFYRLGIAAAAAGRSDEALSHWEHVWGKAPGYEDVADRLKDEYFARGIEAYAAGRVDEAVAQWRHVLRIDPDDARAVGYLRHTRKQDARFQEIRRESAAEETNE